MAVVLPPSRYSYHQSGGFYTRGLPTDSNQALNLEAYATSNAARYRSGSTWGREEWSGGQRRRALDQEEPEPRGGEKKRRLATKQAQAKKQRKAPAFRNRAGPRQAQMKRSGSNQGPASRTQTQWERNCSKALRPFRSQGQQELKLSLRFMN